MWYLALKALHVLSVVLFLGNIITGVFWKWHADRTGDLRARAQALDGIIKSDAWFTVPGVLLIIATGVALAFIAQLPLLRTFWIGWSLVLFGVSGLAFAIKVGPLQKKLLANTQAGLSGTWNEAQYHALSKSWGVWGSIATGAPLIAVFLMVMKPVGV
ncbi:MAG TPA: DUF2269 family protein [Steroidobacteraceae bacterium]|nr:DUF2269 family protein [Steroidobacteraceae bacterium]